VAVGGSIRTSHWTFIGADAFVMPRKRDAALPSGIKPLAGRSPSRKCVHAACHLPWLPNRLSALFSPGAVLGQRHQRRSPSECCSPFVPSSCHDFEKAYHSWTNAVGRYSWSSASSHLDGTLAQPIGRGTSTCGNVQRCFASSSPTACGSVASSLELARSACTERLVGTTTTSYHRCWCSGFSRRQGTKEE
jgi:hypothetical protein